MFIVVIKYITLSEQVVETLKTELVERNIEVEYNSKRLMKYF